MHRGMDAFCGLTLVLACGFFVGCASSPRRPAMQARGAAPPGRLPPAMAQAPAPDLRIPGPATVPAPQPGRTASLVVPAAATQPGTSAPQPVTPAAAPQTAPTDALTALRTLHRGAAERYAATDSYIVRLRRREQVNGKNEPEELMLFKFRKQPWSVHMKWIGEEARGREVVCVQGQHGGKLHTRLAAGDVPLMPAGKRMAFDPNSPLVRSSSRHPITQAGVGNLIERFGRVIEAAERGELGRDGLKYLGPTQRPEFTQPCAAVEQAVPPGRDPSLPQGGRRWYFFDPVTRFPTLLVTHDHAGRQVEYYHYDRFELNVRLDDDDFNPDKLWGK